eukprot:SAG31_NODE_684_length_12833_cov_8.046411_11_plen_80_part_00
MRALLSWRWVHALYTIHPYLLNLVGPTVSAKPKGVSKSSRQIRSKVLKNIIQMNRGTCTKFSTGSPKYNSQWEAFAILN